MSPFLIAALCALVALFMTLVEPDRRHVRAIKTGALAALTASLAAWLWPVHAAQLFVAAFGLAALWLFARVVFWPIRFIGRLLRGQ